MRFNKTGVATVSDPTLTENFIPFECLTVLKQIHGYKCLFSTWIHVHDYLIRRQPMCPANCVLASNACDWLAFIVNMLCDLPIYETACLCRMCNGEVPLKVINGK